MRGGVREGSGRKGNENKKKSVTVYLDEENIKLIRNAILPNNATFSQKCRELISIGLKQLEINFKSENNEITFIDLFCGIGGIRIGFEQALKEIGLKGKCVFSSDIKPSAIEAYKNYFGENPKCDITKIDISNLPDFEFLLAGFPCQAFSKAGLGLGFQDTRGTLFFNVAEIIKKKRPRGFVLENVEGLVTHDNGRTYKVIKNTLEELGYNVEAKVLNGKDFGLAQSRNRIYFIGIYDGKVSRLEGFKNENSVLQDIIDYSVPPIKTDFTEKLLAHYSIKELYGKAIKDKRGGGE